MGHRGKAIDYSEINRMLAKDREKSLNILSDMISDNIEGENWENVFCHQIKIKDQKEQ